MLTRKDVGAIKHGGFRSLIQRAIELGVDVRLVSRDPRVIRLSYTTNTYYCAWADMPLLQRLQPSMTRDKVMTKAVLSDVGISTPRGILASTYTEAIKKLKQQKITFPLISKPFDGSLARGVTWDIRSKDDLLLGFRLAKKGSSKNRRVIVEEMVHGEEYRVLVLGGKVVSCVQKIPASIVGDGVASILELIQAFNKTRRKGFEIKVDSIVKKTLKKMKLTLRSVPAEGERIKLRNNLNMSDGGRAVERTNDMASRLRLACEQAIAALGLSYGGIDLITPDITGTKSSYWILEVNSLPYFNMHEKPLVEGTGVDVSALLLKEFFPDLPLRPRHAS